MAREDDEVLTLEARRVHQWKRRRQNSRVCRIRFSVPCLRKAPAHRRRWVLELQSGIHDTSNTVIQDDEIATSERTSSGLQVTTH